MGNFYSNLKLLSRSEQKSKKKFLHFSTFHDPPIPKNQTEKNFCHFIVRKSRPKSLNISRYPNARALILVPKLIYEAYAIKIFSELVGGFWSYPHFSLF